MLFFRLIAIRCCIVAAISLIAVIAAQAQRIPNYFLTIHQLSASHPLRKLPAATSVEVSASAKLRDTSVQSSSTDYGYDYLPTTEPSNGAPAGILSTADGGIVTYTYPLGTLHAKAFNLPLSIHYTSANSKMNLDGIATGVSWSWAHIIGMHQNGDTDFTLYSVGGTERLSVNHDNGKVSFKDMPQDGEFADVAISYCTESEAKSKARCQLPVVPTDGSATGFRFKLTFRRTGQVLYLGITRAEDDADKQYFQRNEPGSNDYRLEYFVPLLLTNSFVDPDASGSSGSYIQFEYRYNETDPAAALQQFSTYEKDSKDGVYGIPVLSKLISDAGAEMDVEFTSQHTVGEEKESSVVISEKMLGKLSRKITLTADQVASNPDPDINTVYPSQYQPYPNINLTKIEDQDARQSNAWAAGELYATILSYETFSNDYVKDGKHPTNQVMPVPYSYGDAILDKVKAPNGSTETADIPLINITGGKDNHDNTFSALVVGMPLCETDEQQKDSMGVVCRFYDKNGTDYASFFSLPMADYITDTDAQGTVSIEREHAAPQLPSIKNANDENPTRYTNSTGFPYISPLLHKNPALWKLHNDTKDFKTGIYDDAPDPYQYYLDQQDVYTGDKGVSHYGLGPYLQISQSNDAASGLVDKVDYFYSNYDASSGVNVTHQAMSFSSPTTVRSQLSDVVLDGQNLLQSKNERLYNDYGDIDWTVGSDKTEQASYYSYGDDQNADDMHPYYLLIADVSLPYLKNDTDGQPYSPDDHQAYAYYTYNTVDTTKGTITKQVSGYVQCQLHAQSDGGNAYNDDDSCYHYMDRSGLFSLVKTAATANKSLTWLSREDQRYDVFGRLAETQAYVSVEGSWQPSIKTDYSYIDDANDLSAEGIDISKLPSSLLSTHNRYVIKAVTSDANMVGDRYQHWASGAMQKSLSVIDAQSGRLLGQFWGYDNDSTSSTYQGFSRGTVYEYDGFGVPRQTIAIDQKHASAFNYSVGANGLSGQTIQTNYYCPSLTVQTSLPVDFSNCQALTKSVTTIDSLGRVINREMVSYNESGQLPEVMRHRQRLYHDTVINGHSASEGVDGILQQVKSYQRDELVSTTTPIYNASHVVVGSFRQIAPSSDQASVNGDQHSSSAYTLSLNDPVKNRQYAISFIPCQDGNGDVCAKYLTVSQYEVYQDNGIPTIYDAKSNRLLSTTRYRYASDDSQGYDPGNDGIDMADLKQSLKDPNAAQGVIDHLVVAINTQLDQSNGLWKLSSKISSLYDIYNHVTEKKVVSDHQQQVSLYRYNPQGELVTVSNATKQNLINNGESIKGRSNWPSTQDIATTQYNYNALGQQTQIIMYADNPNNPISQLSDIKQYHEQNVDEDALGLLQSRWLCAGTNSADQGDALRTKGCRAANSADTDYQSRELFSKPVYDDLNRLIQSEDAKQTVFTTVYNPVTGQVVQSSATDQANQVVGVCSVYDPVNGLLRYRYDHNISASIGNDSCPYQTVQAITDALEKSPDLQASLIMMSYTYLPYSHLLEKMTYPDGRSMMMRYDSQTGVLISTTDVGGFQTNYHYYLAGGQLPSGSDTQLPNGNTIASQAYAYDRSNRIKEIEDGASVNNGDYAIESLSYQDGIDTSSISDTWNRPSIGLFTQTYTSDAWGLVSLDRTDMMAANDYHYNALSRLIGEGGSSQYQYDVSGDLQSATNNTGGTTSWTSSRLNQLISRTDSNAKTHREYGYDGNGNMLYNDQGCFDYNPAGQLISFQQRQADDRDDSCRGQLYNYTYLPDGHRWTKESEKADKSGRQRLTYYNGSIAYSSQGSAADARWVLENMSHVGSGAWLVTNQENGDILTNGSHAVYLVTGNQGNILGTDRDIHQGLAVYDGYGHLLRDSSSLLMKKASEQQTVNPFNNLLIPNAFHGALADIERDSFHYYYRDYDLNDNRWLQSDPDASAMNSYLAWGDDGINEVDPLGADSHPMKHFKGAMAGLANAGLQMNATMNPLLGAVFSVRDLSINENGELHGHWQHPKQNWQGLIHHKWYAQLPIGSTVYQWQKANQTHGDPKLKGYMVAGAVVSTVNDVQMVVGLFFGLYGWARGALISPVEAPVTESSAVVAETEMQSLISQSSGNLQEPVSYQGDYKLNPDHLVKPNFIPKIDGVPDKTGNYQFDIIKYGELGEKNLKAIKSWSQIPSSEDSNVIFNAKSRASSIWHNIQVGFTGDELFYSVFYKDGELLGVSEFIQSGDSLEIAATTSSIDNLSSTVGKVSGFGKQLKYNGILYAKENIFIDKGFTVESNAITDVSGYINQSLGFENYKPVNLN